MTRVAAFDCGTNSLRLLVADLDAEAGTSTELVREMRIVRLGQGVDRTGRLSDAALQRVFTAVEELMGSVREHDVSKIAFCATSAARAAWAAAPRMWRTCVALASGCRYAAAAACAAEVAACRAASPEASLAARWASAEAVRCRRERGAPSAKTRAARMAAAGRGSSGRSLVKRTSDGSAHAAPYPAIERSSSSAETLTTSR